MRPITITNDILPRPRDNAAKHVYPQLNAKRIGIVSRDYSRKYTNGFRDFSQSLPGILTLLNDKACDTVLLSPYSIVARKSLNPVDVTRMQDMKSILYEEFIDGAKRHQQRFVVSYRSGSNWREYEFQQAFGTLTRNEQRAVDFVHDEMPKRIFGNCCVLLCGETNGVKYSPKDKSVHDVFGLRKAIPKNGNCDSEPCPRPHDQIRDETQEAVPIRKRPLGNIGVESGEER